jgi:hypothetical protein
LLSPGLVSRFAEDEATEALERLDHGRLEDATAARGAVPLSLVIRPS